MESASLQPRDAPGKEAACSSRADRSASMLYQIAILAAAALLIFSAAL